MNDWGEVCAALRRGCVVAAATESSFGLLADVSSAAALDTLVALKPRGRDKGQPVIVPHLQAWRDLVRTLPPEALGLAQRFWPGPLTVVLEARAGLDRRVTLAGTLAARLPGPSAAHSIVRAYGAPLTATSANPPGAEPALDAAQVAAWFSSAVRDGRLMVVPGRAPGGPPSSLVKLGAEGWTVLREGPIAAARILQDPKS